MPRPNWDSEDQRIHPTAEARSHLLTGPENAFLARIKNKDDLTPSDQDELRRLWFKVDGDSP